MIETHTRTMVRALSYRFLAWLATIPLSLLFMDNLTESAGFSTALHVVLTAIFYAHERVWIKIKWGFRHDAVK